MKKIAILGCENSHANEFLKFIKNCKEFNDIEVVGVYSDEKEPCEKLNKDFGVPILSDYTNAVGKIDGLIITARHGDNHYKYMKPYIKSGIPTFIDKPITICEEEALIFMKELKKANVKITGGSSLKQDAFIKQLKEEALNEVNGKTLGGFLRAPLMSASPYGGFYFYAQHLVEMVCEIFGRYPISVTAKNSNGKTEVVFNYKDYSVTGLYVENSYHYYALRTAEKGTSSGVVETREGNDWFYNEFKEFYQLLNGEAQKISYEDFISPVFIMNAIERSIKSGKEEIVREYTL